MSELMDNKAHRVRTLKAIIKHLHAGRSPEEVKSMCDLHSQVTRETLVQIPAAPVAPGHPADTFRRENQALREVIARARATMAEIEALPDDGDATVPLMAWRQAYNDLMDVDSRPGR